MRVLNPFGCTLHSIGHLHTFLRQCRIYTRVPVTYAWDSFGVDVRVVLIAVAVVSQHTGFGRRTVEAGIVGIYALMRCIVAFEGKHHIFLHTRPVRYIMVHECAVVGQDLVVGLRVLPDGCELQVVVRLAAVTPEHRVVYQSAVTDIYATRTSVTTTVVHHIRSYTVVCQHRAVVERTALVQIDTATLGVRGVVADHTCGTERREVTDLVLVHRFAVVARAYTFTPRVLSRYVTDSQTCTDSRTRLRQIRVLD